MRDLTTAALLALAFVGLASPAAAATKARKSAKPAAARAAPPAEAPTPPSHDTVALHGWVITSRDNGDLPFLVIDKVAAEVFVFDDDGTLLGQTPALLGVTPGDESAEGVGDRELSEIKPEDRTTPAGRFVASVGRASGNRKVLWVDYPTSVSLHPVVTTKKKERRLQRLKSRTAEDNRITYGCINVPAAFYAKVVRPLFAKSAGVVYILPETKPLNQVFLAYQAPPQSPLAVPPAANGAVAPSQSASAEK